MKFNISFPVTASQKTIEIDDERKLRFIYDKRMGQEIEGEGLGEQFKGYTFKITGGNDKQGFPMMQGVLLNQRVRLLLDKNSKCYRTRRDGERKRKSVRGCIVGPDLSVVALMIVKKGEQEIPGITDVTRPRRLGPKRATKIRKLFNLTKDDDVRKFVIPREVTKEGKKPRRKAPKIQRLVTPVRLQRKRAIAAQKKAGVLKSKQEAADYHKLLLQKQKEKRSEKASARRSSRGSKASKPSAVAK
eukprot:TRINITY_DN1800_c0_g1::TRINITY_DN1800_c0_g1_i1::g.25092::m.25092 TRINITY_DN1800_c0_g1::TRINITY_DN1800_c0_g1_i1::g.25092  ORF type:complete len:245 (+),score=103.96,sp/P62755/RS6_RAT/62.92/2e-99,Ribosomal_S6e/PF01092.14/1.8e-55,Ribosomal_S6e/PF01092.14/4.5e+03 TRINITY_DN1800_c0_g1_i1:55-789(+)